MSTALDLTSGYHQNMATSDCSDISQGNIAMQTQKLVIDILKAYFTMIFCTLLTKKYNIRD